MAISPDGRLLASDDVNAVNLWSLPDGALLKSLSTGLTQYSVIRALAISPDGRLLAAGLENGEIHLWSLPDGAPVTVISAHPEPGGANGNGVSAVTIGRNGVMVSAGGDTFRSQGKVKLWSLPDGLLQTTLTERHCGGWWISPDRRLLAFGQCEGYSSGARVELRSLPDGAVKATLTGFQDYLLNLIAMSPDGQLLVSNTRYGQPIKLWSVPDNKVIKEISLQEPEWGWSDLIISPDGRWLAAGVYSSTPAPSCVKLWSLPDAALRKTLTSDFPVAVTISPDGEWLASAGYRIALLSLPDGKLLPACFIKREASYPDAKLVEYTRDGLTYSLPCGSPIPPGAECTCNCVSGTRSSGGGGGGYWYPN